MARYNKFDKNIIYSVAGLFFIFLIQECASPTKDMRKYMLSSQLSSISSETKHVRVSLGSVTLGCMPQVTSEGEMVRQALEAAIKESNLYSETATEKIDIELRSLIFTKVMSLTSIPQ